MTFVLTSLDLKVHLLLLWSLQRNYMSALNCDYSLVVLDN